MCKSVVIIIIGQGVRLSNEINAFAEFLDLYPIPFVTTKLAIDILPEHPCNKGMVGIRGNYKIPQDIETIYILGASMSLMTRGYNDELFNIIAKGIRVENVKELQSLLVYGKTITGVIA